MRGGLSAGGARPTLAKHIFVDLEGLRGVAALFVVIFHIGSRNQEAFVPSAYLAVDLFFLLSGFVLAYRYLDEIERGLSMGQFVLMRAIRLYPLFILGCFLTLAPYLLQIALGRLEGSGILLAIDVITSVIALPNPVSTPNYLYPLNGPAWTLMAEIFINAIFILVAPFRARALWWIVILSGALLGYAAWTQETLNLGSTWKNDLWRWGFVRVTFSFFVGVLIFHWFRAKRLPRFRLPLPLLFAFVALFFMPQGSPVPAMTAWLAIIILFPIIIIAAIQTERQGVTARIMRWLGLISYPIYALHWGLLHITETIAKWVELPSTILSFCALPLILLFSWAALRYYDGPARSWLGRLVFQERSASSRHQPETRIPSA